MICLQCRLENREGAKFCKNCGAKLESTCPKCNALLSPDSKFCDECGAKVSSLSQGDPKDVSHDEKLTKIQKYLPKGLAEKILSQRDRIEGERKQVTVMFCDMADLALDGHACHYRRNWILRVLMPSLTKSTIF